MNVLEVIADEHLLGPHFAGASWEPWRAALAALYGLRLDGEALALYRQCTGRQDPPVGSPAEGWFICGRRAGKSRVASAVAVFESCFKDHSCALSAGERGVFSVLAADRRQARVLLRYIAGLLSSVPMLAKLVESTTAETISLRNGVDIEVLTANFRSVRGRTLIGCVCDELAFWRDEDSAHNPASEVLAALQPSMATIPGAKLVVISSPHARSGALWEAYRENYGREGSDVLVWQAPSRAMNPALSARVVERAYARDPEKAAAEYGAQFRDDVSGFADRRAVEACVVCGRFELPLQSAVGYAAFVDPSGGATTP